MIRLVLALAQYTGTYVHTWYTCACMSKMEEDQIEEEEDTTVERWPSGIGGRKILKRYIFTYTYMQLDIVLIDTHTHCKKCQG